MWYLSSRAKTNTRRADLALTTQAVGSVTFIAHLAAHQMAKQRPGWLPRTDLSPDQPWAGAPHCQSAHPTGELGGGGTAAEDC